jgi:hypothetical protein
MMMMIIMMIVLLIMPLLHRRTSDCFRHRDTRARLRIQPLAILRSKKGADGYHHKSHSPPSKDRRIRTVPESPSPSEVVAMTTIGRSAAHAIVGSHELATDGKGRMGVVQRPFPDGLPAAKARATSARKNTRAVP